ncbi:hypothetical protein CR152_25500 [Massilia violaceinigra]|uniref:Fido domain-containing protein n=1 Tax=Massilia violaceinigra TaxID=2045208 RepID=A0A2D2DR78_9BURK|nr:Fic family protein [Massilia violaceinigra]ATQ77484.1 hypothetical protein CR152_25500 [Massilia violaceinigra]
MAMKIPGKLYFPPKWESLDPSLRVLFQEVQDMLYGAFSYTQPNYEQLSHFVSSPIEKIVVRSSIAEVVQRRAKRSLSMSQEIACFRRSARENVVSPDDTVYEAGLKVRYFLFGKFEHLRMIDLTIAWHDWMLIPRPAGGDPVFNKISTFHDEPDLYSALNIYLILLTSHPYTDGNGRTARLLFNLYFNKAQAEAQHYIPLAELTLATAGQYEEYIGTACEIGDFLPLISFLLNLLKSYANFLKSSKTEKHESELTEVLNLVKQRQAGTFQSGINSSPPYLIAVSNIIEHINEIYVNRGFVDHLLKIALVISRYGSIDFAMTGLADIVDGIEKRSGSISFFVKAYRKEELLLHFRELCTQHRDKVRLRIVITSDEPVVAAKLLAALIPQYTGRDVAETTCPILLHDFNHAGLQAKPE